MCAAFYNENDKFAAQWLRNLISAGLIAEGDVDERSVEDVRPDDLRGYEECHFFAGIGGFSCALRLAGWPDNRSVWTASLPCPPFSSGGKGRGFADERHLWPAFFHLVRQCHPPIIFGEQVEGAIRHEWLDLIQGDLEGEGYAVGAVVFGAHSVGAPHIRQRIWWVARSVGNAECDGPPDQQKLGESEETGRLLEPARSGRDDSHPSGFWADVEWITCRDGKRRPVEPGTLPMAHGVSQRVGRLRAYGNAIVPQVGAEFIRAFMESRAFTSTPAAGPTPVSRACSMTQPTDQNALVLTSDQAASASAPEQQMSILAPEPREVDFLKFDLSAVDGKSESEKRQHADSMELPALGNFIREGLHGLKRLVEAYRPYIENFMERTAHQGEQRMLTNKKGEPASREEVVREQLGVGVRRVNQLLAATGPEPPKPSKTQLTELQAEVVQALVAQGFAKKDAVAMTKAAEGNDFESLFKAALGPGLGNPPPPTNSPVPPPLKSSAPAPPDQAPVVAVDPPVSGGQRKSTLKIEASPQFAELEQLKQERAELREQLELAKAENASLLRRLETLSVVPENLKDEQITASLAAEPDTLQAGERLRIYLNSVGERVLPHNMELGTVSVRVIIVARSSRIMSGDYLEKRNKSPQPSNLLCKCSVEVSEAGRQKVSEWGAGGWGKPHVIYSSDETDYKVITEEAARALAPEAFPSAAPTPMPAKTPEEL